MITSGLPMVANSHFYDDFMTFVFDESFLQAMESNSKTFNIPSAVILLHQLNIIVVKMQNDSTSHKIIEYVFLIGNNQVSFHYSTDFKCFITKSVNC